MRLTITAILFIYFLPAHSFGQLNKQINIPIDKKGDTSLWYKWQHEKDNELKLPHVVNSTDKFHFRFWGNQQAVDIWTNDNKLFYGLVTNYTYVERDTKPGKWKSKPYKIRFNQSSLDTSLARKAYKLIKPINSIPTEDSIKGWGQGCDGIEYIFETSTPANYSFKTYWTPNAQDSTLTEAKLIRRFIKQMEDTLQLKASFEKFFATLKPGSYTSDGSMVTTKFSARQNRLWWKYEPNREHLDSVKDSLNNYLSHTLTKMFKAKGDSFRNYTTCQLEFSAKNKIKKIKADGDFYFWHERVDFHHSRRKIKKAFKQIPITFVYSKTSYWKRFYYHDGKVEIE